MHSWSQVCILLLLADAVWVSVRQWKNARKEMSLTWVLIALYWTILSVKNLCDWLKW